MKEVKSTLNAQRCDAEAIKVREQKIAFDAEIRRLRRNRMMSLHSLTTRVTTDVRFRILNIFCVSSHSQLLLSSVKFLENF